MNDSSYPDPDRLVDRRKVRSVPVDRSKRLGDLWNAYVRSLAVTDA